MSTNQLVNRISIGSWITIGHPAIAEIMASAGFDWLAVDLEHSVITLREAEDLIRVINLKGIVPFVRLSSNSPEQIKRVMDAGAHGVIAPMINSRIEAESLISAVKYPPVGCRSFGLARAQGYGASFNDYRAWEKNNVMVIVQIEHIDAVNNLESILTVDGVDAYFVGPYDLSGSLGIPGEFEHPTFVKALETIRSVGNKLGVPGGIHIVEPDPEELVRSIKEGNQFIAYGVDHRMLDITCRNGLSRILDLRS